MLEIVDIGPRLTLDDYGASAQLAPSVNDLRALAGVVVPKLRGRKLWMVNSTAKGGGVAEMMGTIVGMLRELGVPTEWAVIGTERTEFFLLTKQIHNMIHGAGNSKISAEHRELYDLVSRELADEFRERISKDDILVIHDPQPLGMGALLKKELGVPAMWRCHIGLDDQTPQTKAVWEFLRPHVETYDHTVFTAPEYVPEFLHGHFSLIFPALDPMSHKNEHLSAHALARVLCNAGLMREHNPVPTQTFPFTAERLQPDGTLGPATSPEEIGLLYRTVITQISRWDKLKGWEPLLEAFTNLKRRAKNGGLKLTDDQRRRIDSARLVMAGPETAAVADDPEAAEVLKALCSTYCELEPEIQRDVALLSLPMGSSRINALMVNALQRCSSIIVQNSIQEGFGLTVTEAMWKRIAVMGSTACGIRHQIRDGVDGCLVQDSSSAEAVERVLLEMLNDEEMCETYALSAQRRANDEFLVFAQVRHWLEVLTETAIA